MKLEVKNLRKSFSGNEVLHGISFSVESGKALGLLGRNGAGKTTTIRILMEQGTDVQNVNDPKLSLKIILIFLICKISALNLAFQLE